MQKKIHFVTGKGGVGKSVLAAGLAHKLSAQGSCLLAELGDHSFFQDYLQIPKVSYQPIPYEKYKICLWTGAECLREYARHLIKVESLFRLFFENSVMRTFINIAPALPELAIMGKITSGPRKHGPAMDYDSLIIDAYATGHFIALMKAGPGMASAVPFGPMGEQSRSISETLKNPEICQYHIVTLPEELPLKEAIELKAQLKSEFGVDSQIYLNKTLDLSNIDFPQNPFGEYLRFQAQKIEFARGYLRERKEEFIEIPWILEGTGAEIVRKVGEALK